MFKPEDFSKGVAACCAGDLSSYPMNSKCLETFYAAAGITAGACPNCCSDGVKDADETGVDCGGSCAACQNCAASCDNGVKDCDETAIDVGPSCNNGKTACTNGYQDANEEGIDCGGDCPDDVNKTENEKFYVIF